jgi:hypothetical protein
LVALQRPGRIRDHGNNFFESTLDLTDKPTYAVAPSHPDGARSAADAPGEATIPCLEHPEEIVSRSSHVPNLAAKPAPCGQQHHRVTTEPPGQGELHDPTHCLSVVLVARISIT